MFVHIFPFIVYDCSGQDNVFQVIPSDRELPPQSTGAFAISFWPVSFLDRNKCEKERRIKYCNVNSPIVEGAQQLILQGTGVLRVLQGEEL